MTLFHIRHEVRTREHHGLIGSGKELPCDLFVAWCGITDPFREGSRQDRHGRTAFLDIDHALNSASRGQGFYLPCPDCLRAVMDEITATLPGAEALAAERVDDEEQCGQCGAEINGGHGHCGDEGGCD